MFHSVSMDFDFKVVIEPDEAYVSIAAKDRHHGDVACIFQALLEFLVNSGRPSRIHSVAGVAVKMSEQSMSELLELYQQSMRGARIALHAGEGPLLVRKLRALVEHQDTIA